MDDNRSYRIRVDVGRQNDSAVHVKLTQTFDMFEILSLRLSQTNAYKLYQSDYGIVVGRVYANGGFGVPNARLSIFIEADGNDRQDLATLYGYSNTSSRNLDGIRYNLLPEFVDDACHQDVGTFPNKRTVLDNGDVIEIFEKYYKYTTTTNNSGDYMLFGVPKGGRTLHMDVDLSDIGILSQRPRDMIYKGYDANQFESPNKFKTDKNLTSLVQIISQDAGIYVYPFWGDQTDDGEEIAITRYDIELPYKFEPTCVFMGSIFTDTNGIALGKNCTPMYHQGDMSELTSGEGSIEMIRKSYDGRVEEFQVKGNRVIDGDGVWCYQIPMNLDYMITDEFGNMVPTDNPDIGIPTRARVRFRVTLDEMPNDMSARKRCRYLIPNNPREDDENPNFKRTHEVDYEFGTNTQEESYRDLFWNNVYTVKNYIPRIQKNLSAKDKRHTGIKLISHHGDNNPMPYNNMNINLSFQYRFLCILFKFFIQLVIFVNRFLGIVFIPICVLANTLIKSGKAMKKSIILWPVGWLCQEIGDLLYGIIPSCIGVGSDICGDNVTHNYTYYPGCDIKTGSCVWSKTKETHAKEEKEKLANGEITRDELTTPTRNTDELYNCIETQLAEDNDVTSFEFNNDWINGSLYAPMWYRHITKKRSYLFGLIRRRAKDQWCSADNAYNGLPKLFNSCAVSRSGSKTFRNVKGVNRTYRYMLNSDSDCACKSGKKQCRCHDRAKVSVPLDYGLVVSKETILGQTVYYYKPVEYSHGELKVLFSTDIVLLGSLNDCDINGIPQFFKYLDSTTYNMPPNVLVVDNTSSYTMDEKGNMIPNYDMQSGSEQSGADWGNSNWDLCGTNEETRLDGGLFYSIGCSSIRTLPKSCINLSRICELGVGSDVTVSVPDLSKPNSGKISYTEIPPDGFISYDEVYGEEFRSMFATLNGNRLRTRINPDTSFPVYDFRYINVDAFDNSLGFVMQNRQLSCPGSKYKVNYKLEHFSTGYAEFRMGEDPKYYQAEGPKNGYPIYENSFYFYFGLKSGKTAIDKFNSQFYSNCVDPAPPEPQFTVTGVPNSWCKDSWVDGDGYVAFDMSKLEFPIKVNVHGNDNKVDFQLVSIPEKMSKFVFRKGTDPGTEEDGLEGYKDVDLLPMYDVEIPDYESDGDSIIIVNGNTESDEDIQTLLNGTYTITVEDGNGDIYKTIYRHKPKQMTLDIIESPFEDEEDALFEKFDSREEIAADTYGADGELKSRDIGGTICIDNIMGGQDGRTPVKYIHVEITNDDEEVSGIISCAKMRLMGSRYMLLPDTYSSNVVLENTSSPIFGVPKGNVTYRVMVRELCKDEASDTYWETGNVYYSDVYVETPKPMKLFINDVDYSPISAWSVGELSEDFPGIYGSGQGKINKLSNEGIVSDNWFRMSTAQYDWSGMTSIWEQFDTLNDTARTTCGLMLNPDGTPMGEGEMMISLSDLRRKIDTYPFVRKPDYLKHFDSIRAKHVSNLANVVDGRNIDLLYEQYICETPEDDGFSEDEEYEEENKKEILEAQIESVISVIDMIGGTGGILSQIRGIQDDYIFNVKETFRLNCETSDKEITVRLETSNSGTKNNIEYPQYYYGFCDETANENEEWNNVDKFKTGNTDQLTFSGISVPTVTYPESGAYGSEDFYSTYVVKARNNRQSNKNAPIKWPYFVYGLNKRNVTLPSGNNYFGFHMVDKIFTSQYLSWTSVVRYPIYDLSVDFTNKYINMFGMYAGYILNGYPENVDGITNRVHQTFKDNTLTDDYPTFRTQTIGELNVDLSSKYDTNGDEDMMPLRRLVTGIHVEEGETVRIDGLSPFGLVNWEDGESRLTYINLTDKNRQVAKWCTSDYIMNYGDRVSPIPLAPDNSAIGVSDAMYCSVNDNLYGSTEFEIMEGISDCKKLNNNKLEIKLYGGNDEEEVKYRFYRLKSTQYGKYPINPFSLSQATVQVEIDGVTQTVDTGIYRVIEGNSFPFAFNQSFTGQFAPIETNTTGVCKQKELTKEKGGFFIYAIAERGGYGKVIRSVSPLYCFTQIRAVGGLSDAYKIDFDDEGNPVVIRTSTLLIRLSKVNSTDDNYYWDTSRFRNDMPPYLKFYPFDVSISGETWDNVSMINMSWHIDPPSGGVIDPNYAVLRIPLSEEDTKNYMKSGYPHRIRQFMENSRIEVTDITGMTTVPVGKYFGKRSGQDYGDKLRTVGTMYCITINNEGGDVSVDEDLWFSSSERVYIRWSRQPNDIETNAIYLSDYFGEDNKPDNWKLTMTYNLVVTDYITTETMGRDYFDIQRPFSSLVMITGVYSSNN